MHGGRENIRGWYRIGIRDVMPGMSDAIAVGRALLISARREGKDGRDVAAKHGVF